MKNLNGKHSSYLEVYPFQALEQQQQKKRSKRMEPEIKGINNYIFRK